VVTNTGSPVLRSLELNDFRFGFDSSWELDVFGRIRNEVKAATNDLRAAEEDRRDVLVILLGDLATTYADLRGFQLRLQIAERNIQSQMDTVALTQARAKPDWQQIWMWNEPSHSRRPPVRSCHLSKLRSQPQAIDSAYFSAQSRAPCGQSSRPPLQSTGSARRPRRSSL